MYIYIFTNIVNEKQYVGQSIKDPYANGGRVYQHFSLQNPRCRAIHRAIKKYGRNAFHIEVIHYPGASVEALNAIEQWHIKKQNTVAPNGYNLNTGGKNGIPSEETRRKQSEALKRHVRSPEHLAKIIESNRSRTGKKRKPLTKEQCLNISNALKGKPKSPEHRANLSKSRKGHKHTPETRAKMSKTHTGSKRSPEHCLAIKRGKNKRNPDQLTLF